MSKLIKTTENVVITPPLEDDKRLPKNRIVPLTAPDSSERMAWAILNIGDLSDMIEERFDENTELETGFNEGLKEAVRIIRLAFTKPDPRKSRKRIGMQWSSEENE